MDNGMHRMGQVVTEMIQASQVMRGLLSLRYLPVSLHDLVTEVTAEYEDVCEKRAVCFTVQDLAELPKVNGDYEQLKTAVDNLISNAIKYTPDGGQIYITGFQSNHEVCLSVQDTGMGIPEDQQDDIFEIFRFLGSVHHHSTSKSAYQGGGLGLGLPLVKGIIEAHGGRIWVESPVTDNELMPGSKFTISFLKSSGLR
jgi:signal transduction histidine kinase